MSNYPAGAQYDSNAPYNQPELEPVKVDVTISQTLSRCATIEVSDYTAEEWSEVEPDDEGGFTRTGGINYDFSDTNLEEAYREQEYTVIDLLNYLRAHLIVELTECSSKGSRRKKLQALLEACSSWTVDETEVVEDK